MSRTSKLRLSPQELRVVSFATVPAEAEEKGTVRGHAMTRYPTFCYGALCPPPATNTNCPAEC